MTAAESSPRNLAEAFIVQARKSPDAPAVIDGEGTISFAGLDRESGLIAMMLEGLHEHHDAATDENVSAVPDDVRGGGRGYIAVILDHTHLLPAAIFGVLRAGYAYIAIERDFPPERIGNMLGQSGACAVITTSDCKHLVPPGIPTLLLDQVDLDVFPARTDAGEDMPVRHTAADAPAYILFTSGTTGRPKGVIVSQANVLHYVRAFRHEFHPGPSDRMLQYSVCTFDIFTEELFPTLLSGGALVMAPIDLRSDFPGLVEFIDGNRVTIVSGFPYLLAHFNALPELPESIRLLISGGDVLRYRYVDRILGRVPIYNTYGPSETTVCATYFRCGGRDDVLPDGTFPIGRAVYGAQVTLRDPKGHEVARGEEGEICIAGGGVSEGYLGLPEQTAAVFVREPGTRKTMYRSGDMGIMRDDGALLFLHRNDQQVMIEGRRVEPMEVENVLSHCTGVRQAAVVANFGEDDLAYLTGYVVADKPPRIKVSRLRREMAGKLPEYMIPEFLVLLPEMPVSENGKIARSGFPLVLKDCSFRPPQGSNGSEG